MSEILAAIGALITALATLLLWLSTKQMAKATENIKKSSESQSAFSHMQMVNSFNALAIENDDILNISNGLFKDKPLEEMMEEIDKDRDIAIKKIWIAFAWLNTEQATFFLKDLIPSSYTDRSYIEVLGKILHNKYVRYLVSNRGYYDQFVIKCIDTYESTGSEWEKEWKEKFIKANKENT
jgi:hypothetical protein